MAGSDSDETFLFEGFRFAPRAGGLFRLERGGAATPIALGARALDVLAVLLRRKGELVSKDELMTLVWSGRAVEEANLNVQISKLPMSSIRTGRRAAAFRRSPAMAIALSPR